MSLYQTTIRMRTAYEKIFRKMVMKALIRQCADVVKSFETKSPEDIIGEVMVLVKPDAITELFKKLYTVVGIDFARRTYRNMGGKMQKSEDEWIDIWMAEMESFSRTQAGLRITSITGTTRESVIKIIRNIMDSQTVPEGLGIYDTGKLFQQAFAKEFLNVSAGRAGVIAQTEVLTASNQGSFLAASNMGAKYKIWLTSGIPDPEGKERHVGYPGLHEQRREMHEPFDVRGYAMMHPGDPAGPASEVVNCKCVEVYE